MQYEECNLEQTEPLNLFRIGITITSEWKRQKVQGPNGWDFTGEPNQTINLPTYLSPVCPDLHYFIVHILIFMCNNQYCKSDLLGDIFERKQ